VGRPVLGALPSGGASAAPFAAQQAAGAPTMYDLVIAGGRVIDPSQKLSAERDVAILRGRIAAVAANIPRTQARQVFDAKGKIVTPGLIDIHTHVFEYGQQLGVNSDIVGIQAGATTVVDCGSVGTYNWAGFRKFSIEPATTRIYALLNIATVGCCTDEIYVDPRYINTRAAAQVIADNRDVIIGVKVRIRGKAADAAHDVEVMKAARGVADAAGIPIMMHWTNQPEVLAMLKAGDILAHPFNPPNANTANCYGTGDEPMADKVLPQIRALKDRGIFTDAQAASTHTRWDLVEKAVKEGWIPDSFSTDVARLPGPDRTPASVLAPMSAFLHFGLPLDQVIEHATTIPAKMLPYPEKIGTLEPGVVADVAILEVSKDPYELHDQTAPSTPTLKLSQHINAVATVKGGAFVKKPPTT
jgi:dihydroorotase